MSQPKTQSDAGNQSRAVGRQPGNVSADAQQLAQHLGVMSLKPPPGKGEQAPELYSRH